MTHGCTLVAPSSTSSPTSPASVIVALISAGVCLGHVGETVPWGNSMRIAIEWTALVECGVGICGDLVTVCRTSPSVVARFAMSAVPNPCKSLLISPRLVTEGIVVALLMAFLVFSILPSCLVSSTAIIVTYILILWVTVASLLKSIVAGQVTSNGERVYLNHLLLRFTY